MSQRSYWSSRPLAGSPKRAMILMDSIAARQPASPDTAPSTVNPSGSQVGSPSLNTQRRQGVPGSTTSTLPSVAFIAAMTAGVPVATHRSLSRYRSGKLCRASTTTSAAATS
ncbi:hypothetical protein FrEUN1fDRAFT_3030 [Parafrankia sp. EUN1f]|nr:hypothetical protein FrEUN1fDRAFT_3030 [Parafrankia sp. EUN1f]